jgi:hypothetical protein
LSSLPFFLSVETSAGDFFQPLYNGANQGGLSHARISGQEQSHGSLSQHGVLARGDTMILGSGMITLPIVRSVIDG